MQVSSKIITPPFPLRTCRTTYHNYFLLFFIPTPYTHCTATISSSIAFATMTDSITGLFATPHLYATSGSTANLCSLRYHLPESIHPFLKKKKKKMAVGHLPLRTCFSSLLIWSTYVCRPSRTSTSVFFALWSFDLVQDYDGADDDGQRRNSRAEPDEVE